MSSVHDGWRRNCGRLGEPVKSTMALSMKATVFLGGGRITSALVAGLRLAGYEQGIVVYDRNPEKMRALRRETPVQIARDLKSALLRAEMLIVAVRPASVAEITWDDGASDALGASDAWSGLPSWTRVDGAEL